MKLLSWKHVAPCHVCDARLDECRGHTTEEWESGVKMPRFEYEGISSWERARHSASQFYRPGDGYFSGEFFSTDWPA